MEWCLLCGEQVSNGTGEYGQGSTGLRRSLDNAFGIGKGPSGQPRVDIVIQSSLPDQEEHMVFKHGWVAVNKVGVNGIVTELGPWVNIDTGEERPTLTTKRRPSYR